MRGDDEYTAGRQRCCVQVDEVVEQVQDISAAIVKTFFAKDDEEKVRKSRKCMISFIFSLDSHVTVYGLCDVHAFG